MNELIRIENQKIGGGFVQTVNARELHAFLEVKKDFSNWIKKQIERARLVEGRDFIVITGSPKRANQDSWGGDRRSIDYYLTIEAAKLFEAVTDWLRGGIIPQSPFALLGERKEIKDFSSWIKKQIVMTT